MKGAMKEKRVSWASDSELRQVMLFHSKDCPSQFRQPKTSPAPHAVPVDFLPSADIPPGFGGIHPVKQIMRKAIQIPCINWKCPPKFCVTSNWQVAAGEESEETGVQKRRESTVLEAVYPSTYAIPSSPCVTSDVQGEQYDDNFTLSIPIIPIEEMESAQNTVVHEVAVNSPDFQHPLPLKGLSASECTIEPKPNSPAFAPPECTTSASGSTGLDADIASAASVALTILLKSSEMKSSIDTNLLIEMLSDPKLVKLLTDPKSLSRASDNGTPVVQNNAHPAAMNGSAPYSSVGPSIHEPKPSLVSSRGLGIVRATSNRPVFQPGASFPASSALKDLPSLSSPSVDRIGNLCVWPNQPVCSVATLPYASSSIKAQNPVKDKNYYKDLIRQHGGETGKNMDNVFTKTGYGEVDLKIMEVHQKLKAEELTIKNQKRCLFFNTPKGCRKGSSCPFLHDTPPSNWRAPSLVEEPSSKRLRLGGEIMGR